MPVNDHALDQLFREKEQERTPDTGQMQQHWQQMLQMLPATPGAIQQQPVKSHRLKWTAGIAVTALLITLVLLLRGKTEQAAETPAMASAGRPATESGANSPALTATPAPVTETVQQPLVTNVPATRKPANNSVPVQLPAAARQPAVDSRTDETDFDAFYIHLSRPPQVFNINAASDTLITCKEGTRVKLPAGVFVDHAGNRVSGDFSLIVQEYHRYANTGSGANSKEPGQRTITAAMAKVEAYKGEEKLQIRDGFCIEIQLHPGIDKSYMNRQPAGNQPDLNNAPQQELTSKTISTLGWISTYEARNDDRPKTNLVIRFDAQHNPQQFMSQLAFANAVMPGYIEGQHIVFSNVPVGETVFLVSLGTVHNQHLSCIKKIVVAHEPVTGIQFSPTSAEKYRQQMELLTSLPVKE